MNLVRFIAKKIYEHIVTTVRHHPVTFLPTIFIFLILAAMPIGVVGMLNQLYPTLLINDLAYPLGVLFFSAYYLSICLFFYSYFVTFYLDMWIVTNDRLIDVYQKNLFSRTISELDLYQIQDVTSDVHGLFPSIFNYGNVTIQTAGPVPKFIIHNAHRPHKLRQLVLDLAAEDKRHHNK
ncbi:MAG: hypothetical protein A2538_01750 [Candidatus Magasanikbacteria bacterium RIFOXYD2_FULL_41_14]|uniref:DUF304 domain-containing protein n=1 Tax=Candidatus Magasanikbacteria bacterium RIFOXYD2_FULL_41_14 TaxID=1798709 RepID=A0A1F6PDN7_9BACT|nr:MAG: hypothetical protein A2538_01750 [Candidatus Magasanikbacteria bacterium RIFOXYD2_FULL_41_14]